MRFAFTEQQLELRAVVRQVLERECTAAAVGEAARAAAPDTSTLDSAGARPAGPGALHPTASARWDTLSKLGATGLLVPEVQGGLGLTELDLVGVIEEAGRAALPEPLAESSMAAGTLVDALRSGLGPPGRRVVEDRLAEVASGTCMATVGGVSMDHRG